MLPVECWDVTVQTLSSNDVISAGWHSFFSSSCKSLLLGAVRHRPITSRYTEPNSCQALVVLFCWSSFNNISKKFKNAVQLRWNCCQCDACSCRCSQAFRSNLSVAVAAMFFSSVDTDRSCRLLTGWGRVRWKVFRMKLQNFRLKLSAVLQSC